VDFRLGKTKEAIVRLEGAVDSPTLGPPPDLPGFDGDDDMLPPVTPPRRDGVFTVPTISISPDIEDVFDEPRSDAAPAAANGDPQRLQIMLDAERSRINQLEAKLQQGEAELSSVSMELEKTRAERIDLATQLKTLQDSGGVPAEVGSGLEEEVSRLTEAAKELEESLQAAAAEKEDLAGKVAANATQIEELTAQLEGAQTEASSAREELETTRERMTALEEEKTQLSEARDEALAAAESATEEVVVLTARVTELEEERAVLVAARDEAQQEAAEAKSALEKSADLIEANRRLEEKLAEAATQIEGMESDATAKEEVIASLQSDLENVRTELASAQDKLRSDRERFDKLQMVNEQLLRQYDEVTGALAAVRLGDVTAAEAKIIQQENEVLRGIIMRHIKEEARREQAYRLAQEEMERLEIRSDTLNERINELALPTLKLTDAEKEMLRSPVITVLEDEEDRLTAVVEMLKPDVGDVAATVTPSDDVVATVEVDETLVVAASGESDVQEMAEAVSLENGEEPSSESAAAAASLAAEPPAEVLVLINEARDQFINGNFAAAEELYQKFVDLQPGNLVALANLGVAQFRQGKLTAAQLALERAITIEPNDAFSLTTLGAVMIEQNRIEDAMNYLERANESSSDDPITLNYLGVAASQLNQFGKAEQSLRRAITVQPEYAEAHFNLAVIYATAKPPSIGLAKRHYEKALELGSRPDSRLADLLQSNPGS
jgi:Flp pilus assembly protein TadD